MATTFITRKANLLSCRVFFDSYTYSNIRFFTSNLTFSSVKWRFNSNWIENKLLVWAINISSSSDIRTESAWSWIFCILALQTTAITFWTKGLIGRWLNYSIRWTAGSHTTSWAWRTTFKLQIFINGGIWIARSTLTRRRRLKTFLTSGMTFLTDKTCRFWSIVTWTFW